MAVVPEVESRGVRGSWGGVGPSGMAGEQGM